MLVFLVHNIGFNQQNELKYCYYTLYTTVRLALVTS